jgi:hypothetical protein
MVIRKLNIYRSGSELFHDAPKLKPPRFDLRKRKLLNDPDIDVDSEKDSEDTYDEDLVTEEF